MKIDLVRSTVDSGNTTITSPLKYNPPRLEINLDIPIILPARYVVYFQSTKFGYLGGWHGGQYSFYAGGFFGSASNTFADGLGHYTVDDRGVSWNMGAATVKLLEFRSTKNNNVINIGKDNPSFGTVGLGVSENNYLGLKLKGCKNPLIVKEKLKKYKTEKTNLESKI